MSKVWNTADPQVQQAMRWVIDNRVAVDLEGEIGFGRPCVGILTGGHYVDYEWQETRDIIPTSVQDEYHKHYCVAVLGHGENAERQLLDWVTHIARGGWVVKKESRESENPFDALFHGPYRYILRKEAQ